MKVLIDRYSDDGVQTFGRLYVLNELDLIQFECDTLELPNKDNKPNISCIPIGVYTVIKRYSAKFRNHFHILDVEGRTWILIHPANSVSDLKGCIGVGSDISGLSITNSRNTLKTLLNILPDTFELEITDYLI